MRTMLLRQLTGQDQAPPACTLTILLYENARGSVEVRTNYDQHPSSTITRKEVASALRALAAEYARD